MTRPESSAPDRPFPGSHSAVPGTQTLPALSDKSGAAAWRMLSLEATPASVAHGRSICLPVRAEHVTVSKDVVVHERVVVRRRNASDVTRVDAEVRREELRTRTNRGD